MTRLLFRVLPLLFCLNLLVALAGGPPSHIWNECSDRETAFEASVSGIPPAEVFGRVPRVDSARLFDFAFATKEPAEIQGHASCRALGDWQRFARIPVARFSDSRSLPLEI